MAKIIKYKFLSCEVNHGTEESPVMKSIFLDKSMSWNEINEEIAKREAYNGEYTIEDDGELHSDLKSVPEPKQRQIEELKQKLSQTDYITAKTIDLAVNAQSTSELLEVFSNIHAQYKDVFAQRAAWRARINELEIN